MGCRNEARSGSIQVSANAAAATPPVAVEKVALPDGQTVDLAPNTLNYELQRFLAPGLLFSFPFSILLFFLHVASASFSTMGQPFDHFGSNNYCVVI